MGNIQGSIVIYIKKIYKIYIYPKFIFSEYAPADTELPTYDAAIEADLLPPPAQVEVPITEA